MIRRKYGDWRFRDETNLIRLVEHLNVRIATLPPSLRRRNLRATICRFNSVAMDMVQAQESARASDEFLCRPELPYGVSCVVPQRHRASI